MIRYLDHIQLAIPADSEAEARAFYADLLQLEEVSKPEPLQARGGCWFKLPGSALHLGIETPFMPAKKAHPAFAVEDIQACARRLQDNGIRIIWDTALVDVSRFYAHDPFGNRLEFLQAHP